MTEETFKTYYNPITLDNCQRYLKLLLNMYVGLINKTYEPIVDDMQKHDAQILLQMFFTKGLAVSRILEGLSYEHEEIRLNPIVDHTSLFIISRNLCEYYVTYELIHILPDTDEKHTIMECLFESSGYKYRQRLFTPKMQEEHKEQYDEEQKIINDAQNAIVSTTYYNQLCQKEKDKLMKAFEKRNYQVYLEDDKVVYLTWQDALNKVVKSNGIFDDIYNYFSLNTHPSVIAMNQFEQAFAKEDPEYPNLCTTAICYVISFMSMFLQEYITIFPKAQKFYNMQSEDLKALLTFYDYRQNK